MDFLFGFFWSELVCWNCSPSGFGEVFFLTHIFSLWIFLRWICLLNFFSLRFWWGIFFTHFFFSLDFLFGFFWSELVCWNCSPSGFGEVFFWLIYFLFGFFWGEFVCWIFSPLDFGEAFFLLIYFLFGFFWSELVCWNCSPSGFGEVFFLTHIFSLWIFLRWVCLPNFFALRFSANSCQKLFRGYHYSFSPGLGMKSSCTGVFKPWIHFL